MTVHDAFEVGMESVGSSMSLTRADQVFTVEFEDHFVGTNGADNICIDISHCIAGDFKRERLAARVTIVVTEFLKIIGYLTVNVGQAHPSS
jgi:hypothetical protein